jgi:hypothetical protein
MASERPDQQYTQARRIAAVATISNNTLNPERVEYITTIFSAGGVGIVCSRPMLADE